VGLKRLVGLVIALLVGGAVLVPIGLGITTKAAAASGPCQTMSLGATNYQHVIWVWMENQPYSNIIGSPNTPYINNLAGSCGLATNYHNISHPSLPNYIAATSGLGLGSLGTFSGDCNPSRRCSTTAASIFGQGETWKAYEESMGSNCARQNSGEYAVRHNPPPYYRSLKFCKPKRLVRHGPKVSYDVPYGQLSTDLAFDNLPAFSFVTPNLIDDMHSASPAQGDQWLANNLPAIFNSSAYQNGHVVVFLTWDEGEGGSSNDCASNTSDTGCHVVTIVASPSTPMGATSGTLFNHYSLLRTTEEILGLTLLGQAGGAASMGVPFTL
jgi:hypothetical protein